MKMRFFALASAFGAIAFCYIFAFAGMNPKTLSYAEANKRWGQTEFNEKGFKNGNLSTKAKMATFLLMNNTFRSKKITDVWSALGKHDGYYQNDVVPAYIIDDTPDDVWQIVFLVDSKRIVTDVAIQKNCCEK